MLCRASEQFPRFPDISDVFDASRVLILSLTATLAKGSDSECESDSSDEDAQEVSPVSQHQYLGSRTILFS